MLTEREKLKSLTNLGIELNQVHDLDILLERILTEARRFVNADAGSIYLREGNLLHFSYTQNDTLQSHLPKNEKLIYSTFSMPINKKSIAGYVAATGEFLNIPDVHKLKSNVPYCFSNKFDKLSGYRTRSVLTIPLKNSRDDILGILQIINAQNEEGRNKPFTTNDDQTMFHFASIASVALERAQMTRAILLRMIKMAELRDPKETGAHVNRVAGYAVEIYEGWARKNKIQATEIEKNRDILRMGAMLHDVGKVAISDLILKKPARFTPEEFEIMKQHTIHGARLFISAQSDFDDIAQQITLNHHERWDGKGYPGWVDYKTGEPLADYTLFNGKPRGKKGKEIPLFGRIVALADVYDALSSRRVYKEAWEEEKVLSIIREERGFQFDPELVDVFFSKLKVIKSIQKRYSD